LDLGLSACHPQMDPKLWPPPEGQNGTKPASNCLRTSFLDIDDVDFDYEMLINRVQRHTCRILYCLKKFLESHRCRFGYPLTLIGFIANFLEGAQRTDLWNEIVRTEDFPLGAGFENGKLQIVRNHPRLVMHVPELLNIWRGNIDGKLIDDPKKFLKYALKYMLKPEQGSLAFTDIIKTLTLNADDSAPVRKFFQKILLKTVGEHDISKNEAWRIVSGKPYVQFSRPFRFLNLTGSRRVNIENNENADQPAMTRNFCDIYWAKETDENYLNLVEKFENGQIAYPRHPKDVSLFEFAAGFTDKWHISKQLYVPKPTPCFSYVPIPDNVEYRQTYCEVMLLLHKPGSTPSNLLDNHEKIEEAMFEFASGDDLCPKVIKEEYLASLTRTAAEMADIFNNVEDLVASDASAAGNIVQEDWMVGLGDVLRQTDIMDPEPEIVDDEEDFMDIEVDDNIDWSSDRVALDLSNQQVDEATDWIPRMKVSANLDQHVIQGVPPETLNIDQRPIFDAMMSALADEEPQKLIDVSGGAGTGKSYLIRAILQQAQENSGHRNLVKITCPTGSAASHFPDGQTLHSLLKIPVKKGVTELDDLSGGQLASLQETFKYTRAIIIDEKGMVGLGRFSQINRRLKQAKPEAADLPFGGLTILLAGDLRQLLPIGDYPLYSQKGGELFHQQGRVLYKLFDKETYCLHQQMRQQGSDNQEFREQLERLATGGFNISDWKQWSEHDITKLDEEKRKQFVEEATMLCAKKKDMTEFNAYHLKRTGNPIARLRAGNSTGASAFDADQAQGLRNLTYLSKGAKIVLTSNLWASAKLVNGSQGTVEYLIYKEGRTPSKNLPDLVICHFPGYIGPSFVEGQDKLVPLAAQRVTWYAKNQEYSRTQYPLILSYALTIHKAQG
jgi:ATP-dependent DNA helicase PIF1